MYADQRNEHPSVDDLLAFAEGRLTGQSTDQIATHIEFCDLCADRVENLPVDFDSLFFVRDSDSVERRLQDAPSTSALLDSGSPVLDDHLRVLEIIGSGGMGIVYRAWQQSVNRYVAVKLLHIPLPHDDSQSFAARERFQREIRALGRVHHPHLAKIHTSGVAKDGRLFYSMDLIDGANLSQIYGAVIQQSKHHSQKWSWNTAVRGACENDFDIHMASDTQAVVNSQVYVKTIVRIIRQIASAVQCLHDAGIVHRDIKPSNIMIDSAGTDATLMDLGLAGLIGQNETRLTRTGLIAGTLPYISPEQFRGAPAAESGDIYNLGVVLWEFLAFQRLFAGDGNPSEAELMNRTLHKEPPSIRDDKLGVSADLDAVVLKCLEKQPALRYSTAAELIADIDRWLDGESVSAKRRGLGFQIGRRIRSGLRTSLAILLACVLAMVAIIYGRFGLEIPNDSTSTMQSKSAGLPVKATVISDGSLVAHWTADGTGNTAADNSRNGNHGALIGDATRGTGQFGKAFLLDGDNDYISFGRASKWNFLHDGSPFTITGFVAPAASNFAGGILSTIDEQSTGELRHGLCVRLDGSRRIQLHIQGAGGKFPASACSTSSIPAEVFTAFAVTFDGQFARLFVNGLLEATNQVTGTFVASMAFDALSLGSIGTTSGPNGQAFSPFAGRIDEVQIYNRALGGPEIMFLSGMTESAIRQPQIVPILRAEFFADGGAADDTDVAATFSGDGMNLSFPIFPATHSAENSDCFLTAFSDSASLHYDFGKPQVFRLFRLWNYHGGQYGINGNGRGVKKLRLFGSNAQDAFADVDHDSWELLTAIAVARAPADGAENPYGEEHVLNEFTFRYVRIQIDENYGCDCVGLAEVQFMN